MEDKKTKRVVIVEDDDMYLGMLKMKLELEGYKVDAMLDAVAGFERIRKVKPDLVVLDLSMPGTGPLTDDDETRMDKRCGHKICRMIKFDHQLKTIPILILTCSDSTEDINLAMRAGADAFLMKTSGTDALISVVYEMTHKHSRTFAMV